jgi:hypothetical protein
MNLLRWVFVLDVPFSGCLHDVAGKAADLVAAAGAGGLLLSATLGAILPGRSAGTDARGGSL